MTVLIGVLSASNIFGIVLKLIATTATEQKLLITFSVVSGKDYRASTLCGVNIDTLLLGISKILEYELMKFLADENYSCQE